MLVYCSREDEHALIQQYCQTLGGESPVSQPQSPAQILKSVEKEERGELERIIADLEEEQRSQSSYLVSELSPRCCLSHACTVYCCWR